MFRSCQIVFLAAVVFSARSSTLSNRTTRATKCPTCERATSDDRFARRVADSAVIEQAFAVGRGKIVESTQHRQMIERAKRMMSSEQLQAFEIDREPQSVQSSYGDTPFGRACLAARRLTDVGVRCVEVTLSGWDTHTNNFEGQNEQAAILDPALAALLADLRERRQLDRTLVVCCGEFGRTPKINALDGRDHWPHGFSMLIAGGRFRRGLVHGQTDPNGEKVKFDEGTKVADLHATILKALSIDGARVAIPHRSTHQAERRPPDRYAVIVVGDEESTAIRNCMRGRVGEGVRGRMLSRLTIRVSVHPLAHSPSHPLVLSSHTATMPRKNAPTKYAAEAARPPMNNVSRPDFHQD